MENGTTKMDTKDQVDPTEPQGKIKNTKMDTKD